MSDESPPPPLIVTISSLDGDGDVVEFGAPRRRRRGVTVAVAVLAAAAVIVLAIRAQGAHHAAAGPAASASASPGAASSSAGAPLGTAQMRITPHLLGVDQLWQLAALSSDTLYRVDLSAGLIGTTRMPQLPTRGDASFVYGGTWAIVMPAGGAPGGYLIPDGDLPIPLSATIAGPVLPGPDGDHVWVRFTYSQTPEFGLFDPVDAPFPGSIVAPASVESPGSVALPATTGDVWPDGEGGLLTAAEGQLWRGGSPDPIHVGSGHLLAVGPGVWLVEDCATSECAIDRVQSDSGKTATTAPFPGGDEVMPGRVSPDGLHAALLLDGELELFDARSGDIAHVDIAMRQGADLDSIAWSPDGRWLLAADANGSIDAFDVAGSAVHRNILPSVTGVTQIAVRPAA